MWKKLRKRPIQESNITKLQRKMRDAAKARKNVRFDNLIVSQEGSQTIGTINKYQ